ncbi:hypothetical protein D9M68_884050 [compost metagenome]
MREQALRTGPLVQPECDLVRLPLDGKLHVVHHAAVEPHDPAQRLFQVLRAQCAAACEREASVAHQM